MKDDLSGQEGHPPRRQDGGGSSRVRRQRELVRNQLRCIVAVDEGVGKILKALEETKQLDNTFIIFTSDNGYFWNEHQLGDKRAAYEEAIRVPMVVRYPKLIKPGTQIEQMVLDVDFAPTFCELAQSPSKPATLHGRSMLPLFTGDINGQPGATAPSSSISSSPPTPTSPPGTPSAPTGGSTSTTTTSRMRTSCTT